VSHEPKSPVSHEPRRRVRREPGSRVRALAALALLFVPAFASAQPATEPGMVQLDFNDVELAVVIDTISQLTGTNFIYDDKVRGRVTVISPQPIVRGS